MASHSHVLIDAHWLPHRYDSARDTVEFIRLSRERLSHPRFLADVRPARPEDVTVLPLGEVAAASPRQAPVHFIVHTAFCRSTLLIRALEQPGLSAGLSEPGVVASLVSAGVRQPQAIAAILPLLARPWGEGEAVFVKPTNHANMIAPAMLETMPQSRAVLMTNPLPSFLKAVVRKGMMGRRWARTLYLELMGYAGMDLGMDGREQFAMTDLQAGALAWFLNQRFLATLQQRFGERVRVLDGDTFAAQPARTLQAVGDFTGVQIGADRARAIAEGPVFASDAKTGEDYAEKSARDAQATESAVVADEIAKLEEWVGMIAGQAGMTVPLKQTLF